jgi:3-phosphoshikimate 1-carboxyvinyltransferase
MRLLAGVAAGAPFTTVLDGDASLRTRPMDRIATPLSRMGATVRTDGGRPPVEVTGGGLAGITYDLPVASAQVKSAILLAGLAAEGTTTVVERLPTRDHTERALAALGGPVKTGGGRVSVERFQHRGFEASVPGDPSSAAFLVAAAILTGAWLTLDDVGLNPTRTAWVGVLERMGASVHTREDSTSLGEPVGQIHVKLDATGLRGVHVTSDEFPGLVDEIPVLAAVAAHAEGESRFDGLGELRVKESDRLAGLVDGIRGLGGEAKVEAPDTLVVAGGGLGGGSADGSADHRMAMAFAVAALAARGPSTITGMEAADVSFPGFVDTLLEAGASLDRSDR